VKEEQFRRGIEEFNHGYYFECHDTFESVWLETRGSDRLFLLGLIQITVGFCHFFNGNYKGSASQLTKGLDKLGRYRPSFSGIELEQFMKDVVRWLAIAEKGVNGESLEIDTSKVPKLQIKHRHLLKEI
jgi:uncharacterized protein